jgi:hypothetical protein
MDDNKCIIMYVCVYVCLCVANFIAHSIAEDDRYVCNTYDVR